MNQSYSFTQLSIFLHAPAKSGVYLLCTSGRCIYVGETENLRKSLLAHFHGDIPWITVWAPSRFSFQLCSDESKTQLKNQLSARLQPVIGDHGGAIAATDWTTTALIVDRATD
jgi:excinuclease UvrABC nuclease subunit